VGKETNPMLSLNPGSVGETSNLVVKVDVKENVVEVPMMASTELLEA
jgi:hypothetical protein